MLEQIEQEWSIYWFNFVTSLDNPSYSAIASNPNLSTEIIKSTIDHIDWSKYMCVANQNIDLHTLIDLGIPYYMLVKHKQMTMEFVLQHYTTRLYDLYSWGLISGSKFVTLEHVKNNISLPWDWYSLSKNPSIKLEEILETKNIYPWVWDSVSSRDDITYEIANNHPEIQQCKVVLRLNAYYNISMIQGNHFKKSLDIIETCVQFKRLSQKHNIQLDYIEANIDKMWDWNELSHNKNLTDEFIDKYIDKNWNITELSYVISPAILRKYPFRGWNYINLQLNPNITIDCIPETKMLWDLISRNPTVTFDYIKANLDKPWKDDQLCYNRFIVEKENFIRKRLREWFVKSDLKEELMKKLHKPCPNDPDKWVQRQIDLGFFD